MPRKRNRVARRTPRDTPISARRDTLGRHSWVECRWPAFALIVLFALAVGLTSESWLFNAISWLDPWFYTGLAQRYDIPSYLNSYYKISRLPWLLFQYSVHRLLPPVAAQYVLQYTCLLAAASAVYWALRRLTGALPALVGALLLVGNTYYVGDYSGGADYHNVMASALYAVAFLFLTLGAADARQPRWLLLFGAAYAMAVHTQVLFLNLAPALALHYFLTARAAAPERAHRRPMLMGVKRALYGGLIATLVLGAINRAFGRNFLFFVPQFKIVGHSYLSPTFIATWWIPTNTRWFETHDYLGPLAATFVISVAALAVAAIRYRRGGMPAYAISLLLQYVVTASIWIGWQLSGKTMLQPNYFAHPLIISQTLAMAAIFALFSRQMGRRWQFGLAGSVAFAALLLPFVLPRAVASAWGQGLPMPVLYSSILVLGVPFLVLALAGRTLAGLIAALVLLGAANGITGQVWSRELVTACHFRRSAYVAIWDAGNRLKALDPTGRRTFIWNEAGERVSPGSECTRDGKYDWSHTREAIPSSGEVIGFSLYDFVESLASAVGGGLLAGTSRDIRKTANIDPARLADVAKKDPVIAFVTLRPELVAALVSAFAAIGERIEIASIEPIHLGAATLDMYILRKTTPAAPGATKRKQSRG